MIIEQEIDTIRHNIALDRQRIRELEDQMETLCKKLEILEITIDYISAGEVRDIGST